MADHDKYAPPTDLLAVVGDLSAIAAMFAEVRELDGLVRPLEAVLDRLLVVEYDALYLWDFEASKLRCFYSRGFTPEERREAERTALDRHPGKVFRERTILHIPDIEQDPQQRSQTSAGRRLTVRSRLFIPVCYGEQSLGSFGLASPRPNAFTPEHVAILEFVCRLIGVLYRQLLDRQERQRTERALESTARRLQLVINSLPIALIAVGPDGRIELAEGAALELLEGHRGAGSGTSGAIGGGLVGEPIAAALGDLSLDALLGDRRGEGEDKRGAAGDGAELVRSLGARALGLRGFRSEVGGAMLLLEDVTERQRTLDHLRELNAELRRARDAAIEATQAKSRFLANMSHELRTPLNAIIGYAEMLHEDATEGVLDPETIDADLLQITGAGKHLLALINDILDLSKIEAGKLRLDVARVNLEALVDDLSATMQPLCRRNANHFEIRGARRLPPIITDELGLRRILLNLLSNASKFTSGGSVVLEIDDARASEGRLRFAVHDTGIGMNPEDLERIWSAFTQVDASTTRRFGGTGLGLTITRELVTLLGGEIEVTSAPGVGSTFRFWIPPLPAGPR